MPGQTYGEAVIKISPMSVIIERGVPENQYIDLYDVPAYFIMDDGSVKTMNQLFNIVSSNLVREDGDLIYMSITPTREKLSTRQR